MFKKTLFFSFALLLILSSSPLIMAQTTDTFEGPTKELFSAALNDYNQKNYSSAAEKFQSLLERNNLSEDLKFSVLYYSTMTAIKSYKTTQAINYLERFNQAGFQDSNLNWKIGELFLNEASQFD
ncbi:MAG: hypothetical protein UMU04_06380, partial [Halanaerobiales bacterium]|nr:hypothetical protein [Halanaerobiales bacterium]